MSSVFLSVFPAHKSLNARTDTGPSQYHKSWPRPGPGLPPAWPDRVVSGHRFRYTASPSGDMGELDLVAVCGAIFILLGGVSLE